MSSPRYLGGYRIGQPLSIFSPSPAHALFHARPRDAPANAPVTHLAKVLLPGEARHKAQFEHGRRLMRNFSHSNIPTVHEVGEQDGIEYFILEYIVGVDLATLLGHPISARSLNSEMALYILAQLTDVLRYIHEFEMPNPAKGDFVPLEVLHRDICPAHVLLSVEGDVLLTGFGSASSWLLRTEHTRETLHRSYQALELQAGAKATPQSDLFSLAAVFWEMLTGHRFKPSQVQTPLGRKVPGVSSKLAEVLRFNLNEDPECRHESAYRVLQRIGQSPEAESAWRSRHELSALVCTAFDARRT